MHRWHRIFEFWRRRLRSHGWGLRLGRAALALGLGATGCTTPGGGSDAAAGRPGPTITERSAAGFLRIERIREHLARLRAFPDPGDETGTPSFPYRCEEFWMEVDKQGRQRFRRKRRAWTDRDRKRFRRLVRYVARRMGAEPRLLEIWALRESTYRPDAVHVLDPDVAASRAAYERYRFSPAKEAALRKEMAQARRGSDAYARARTALRRIQTFRDNPYFDDVVAYEVRFPDGAKARARTSRWHYGYGPFGFSPVYFVPLWDRNAPPWIFCEADGIPAIVTAVWAARRAAAECGALGYEPTYEVVNRRVSGGRCAPRPRLDRRFRARARARGLDPDARARLGRGFPRRTTDRAFLLRTLYREARSRNLLSRRARRQPPPGVGDAVDGGATALSETDPVATKRVGPHVSAAMPHAPLPPAGASAIVRAPGHTP